MRAPLLFIAVPLVSGVAAGASAGASPRLAAALLAGCWLVAVGGVRWSRPLIFLCACIVAAFCAGLVLGTTAERDAMHTTLIAWYHAAGTPDEAVRVSGTLLEDASQGPQSISLAIFVTRVRRGAQDIPVSGGVRVSVFGGLAASGRARWRQGRLIEAIVLLREPTDYGDPAVPSDRERLARQGIALLGTVKSAALLTVSPRGPWLSEAAAALRDRVRRAIGSAVGRWSARSAGVVTAILIGDRSGLDPEDERRLQEAGTYHVIAISGGNIALLTILLITVGRRMGVPHRVTAAAAIAVLLFYGYAAGLAPSVLRATLAGAIYLAGRVFDRRGPALNAVAVAAACAAVTTPLTVLDGGFILSFGATLAIVIGAARLAPRPKRVRDGSQLRVAGTRIAFAARALGAATICAEIALAPVSARLFGRISLAGLVLNFAAIPLMSIIQVAGLAVATLHGLVPAAPVGFGLLAHLCTTALIRSASLVDAVPWLVQEVPPPGVFLMTLWYAAWGMLLQGRPRSAFRRLSLVAIVATAALMLRLPPSLRAYRVPPPPIGWTRVAFIDVGQGDATLLWPAGAAPILIDAGGRASSSFDLGRRVTVPVSWALGVTRLGTLALTHGDPDHVGGAPAVLRALVPGEVWEGVPVARDQLLQRLHASAAAAGIPWHEVRAGEVLRAGAAELRILNPPDPEWERQKVRNDDSIVLEARIGDVAFVLPGDIGQGVDEAVVRQFADAPLVILKAPHHGSPGSSSPALAAALHPSAVIFSAGARNPFGHPAPVVVDRYRAVGARIFRTDEDGAIFADTDGRQVVVWTWRGRRAQFANRQSPIVNP